MQKLIAASLLTALLGCYGTPTMKSPAGSAGSGAGSGGTGGEGGTAGGAGGPAGTAGTAVTAGTGGSAGSGGVSGTCTNTLSDAHNCGACGHDCLGGDCLTGVCQALLLGTVPSTTEYAEKTVVSDGKVYVFTGSGQNPPSSVWQLDASTPGTPTEVTTNGTVSCIMGGKLFWTTFSTGTYGIASCTVANCAATSTPIAMLDSGNYFQIPPGCDTARNEIVWASTSDFSTYKVIRASPTGANARTITTFYFADNSWHVVGNGDFPGETDRIFYVHYDSAAGTDSLYYVLTNVVNSSGVQIATVHDVGLPNLMALPALDLANGVAFLASEYSATKSAYSILSIPLPNGITSGSPPVFTDGYINGGVVDQTTFYGVIWGSSTIQQDAVIKCPLTGCSTPTIMSRGQTNALNFADDATAVYWTTFGQGSNVAIWKAAK